MYYRVNAKSISDGYNQIAKLLREESIVTNGRQQGAIHELQNVDLVLENPLACILTNPYRNMSRKYAAGEWCLYATATNKVSEFERYAKRWTSLAKKDGTISSAYGYRMFAQQRFQFAVNQLIENPDSKNAVIPLRDDSDMEEGLKDRCCTMYLQFRINEDKLDMRVCMRSVDFWFGLPYDVFSFAQVMQLALFTYNKATGKSIKLGTYTHQMLSCHVYEKEWQKVSEMPYMALDTTKALTMPVFDEFASNEWQSFFDWEYLVRHGGDTKELGMELRKMKLHPYFETLGSWLTTKTKVVIADEHITKLLGYALEKSKESACTDRKVGCIVVDDNGNFGIGCNTVNECNKMCDDKHNRICDVTHGEVMALNDWKMRYGVAKPTKAFVTLFPCNPCMSALYDAGIEEIYVLGSMVHKSAGEEITCCLVDLEHTVGINV